MNDRVLKSYGSGGTQYQRYVAMMTDRVNPEIAQMNPVLIGIIFDQVIPILLQCLRNWLEKPTPAQMQALVAQEWKRNPEGLLRKTARRIRGESDAPMTKQQSRLLAKAAIEQMIESPSTEIVSACEEALALVA